MASVWYEMGLWQKKIYGEDGVLAYFINAEIFEARPANELPHYMNGETMKSFVKFELRAENAEGDGIEIHITQNLPDLNIERVEKTFAAIYAANVMLPDQHND
jgi:hypothetical protein